MDKKIFKKILKQIFFESELINFLSNDLNLDKELLKNSLEKFCNIKKDNNSFKEKSPKDNSSKEKSHKENKLIDIVPEIIPVSKKEKLLDNIQPNTDYFNELMNGINSAKAKGKEFLYCIDTKKIVSSLTQYTRKTYKLFPTIRIAAHKESSLLPLTLKLLNYKEEDKIKLEQEINLEEQRRLEDNKRFLREQKELEQKEPEIKKEEQLEKSFKKEEPKKQNIPKKEVIKEKISKKEETLSEDEYDLDDILSKFN